jgi:hypothetical protein
MSARPALVAVLLAAGSHRLLGQDLELQKKVDVDYDKTVDFAKYKTFAWVPFQEPLPGQVNNIRLTRAIESGLTAKGLAKSPSAATTDLYVHFQGKVEKKDVQSTSNLSDTPWQATPDQQWKISFDLKRAEIGTLVIELWDGQTKDIVWRAKGSEMIGSPDQAEDQINQIVAKLLSAYPPKPAAP